jgi:hypothetical protein
MWTPLLFLLQLLFVLWLLLPVLRCYLQAATAWPSPWGPAAAAAVASFVWLRLS